MSSLSICEKYRVLGLIAMVMVVCRHSFNHSAFFGFFMIDSISGCLQYGIIDITEIAVPIFFIISGFFFFRRNYYIKDEYVLMLKRKSKSLILPFLIWNLFGLFIALFLNKNLIGQNPSSFLIHFLNSDYYVVMWYVRDLITLMILVPIYGWVINYNNRFLSLIILVILFCHWSVVDCSWVSSEGMLFFAIGGMLQKNTAFLAKRLPIVFFLLLSVSFILECFFRFYWITIIHKLNIIVGIVMLWQCLFYVPSRYIKHFINFSSLSFFIYASHLYLLRGLKVFVAYFWPHNELVSIIAFLVLPIVTISMLYYIGGKIRHYAPVLFDVITGGRG